MCGVIVVDGGRSGSTYLGRDAYIHDHCLGYLHNYALFYQLLNSNLFTLLGNVAEIQNFPACHQDLSMGKPATRGRIVHLHTLVDR